MRHQWQVHRLSRNDPSIQLLATLPWYWSITSNVILKKKKPKQQQKKNLTTAKKWVVSQSKRRDQDRRRHRPSIFECFRFVSLSFISLSLSLIRRFVPWRCGTWSSSLLFHAFFFGIGWLFVTFGCLLRCFFLAYRTKRKERKKKKKKRRHDAADWSAKAEWIESF